MNADRCGTNKTTASRSNRERKLPVGDSGERVQFSSPPAAYAVGSRCAVVSVVPAARLLMALALVSVLCCASVGRSEEATGPAADTAPAGEAAAAAPAADDDIPLYQRLPYDEVQLDRANDNAVLRVQPIDFPEGEVPDPLPRTGFLEVELVDEPGETYRVAWPHVEEIRPFPQLVLNAAKESISQGQFESAYDHLQFVAEYYPDFAPQEDVVKRFLAAEAEELLAQQAYDRALSNLQRLHDLDAEYAGLQEALGHAINAMVERYVAEDDYPAARQLIGQLEAWYSGHPVAQQWTERWNREASELHAALREDLEAGNDRQAAATARRLMLVRPSLPGIEDAVREALSLYPRVRVGVTSKAVSFDPAALYDWDARRSGRLLYRTLMEFTGPGREGGRYVCPWGRMELENLGTRLVFELRRVSPFPEHPDVPFTATDLARRFLAMADPGDPAFNPQWASLVIGVAPRDVHTVDVDLRHSFVRPEGLLRDRIGPWTSPQFDGDWSRPPVTGPYVIDQELSSERETVYTVAPGYFAHEQGQPAEIVEQQFSIGRDALSALRRGEVDVVDRVNPWELPMIEDQSGIVIGRYAVPVLHCLVPNLDRPLSGSRDFRRALVYGINRQFILNRLLGGREEPGTRVVSGPFAAGTSYDDPLDYAYDGSIEPRPYEPALALALAEVARQQAAAALAGESENGASLPQQAAVVIAHPPNEIAAEACAEIKRQLGLIGIDVRLVETAPSRWPEIRAEVDFLYCELAMWEPVVDVYRLLGNSGPVGNVSPYLLQAMDRLAEAVDWREIGRQLRQIHRLVHDDVTIVPLWQMVDYYAYRRHLDPAAERPVTLYQHVESWRTEFTFSTAAP